MGRLTTHRLVRHRLQRGGWLWSPLRAAGDHRFIVGALRAQRPHQLPRLPLLLCSTLLSSSPPRVGWSVLDCARQTIEMFPPSLLIICQGWELIDLPLRASNEGLLRPRVARAKKIISFHPLPSPPLAVLLSAPYTQPVRSSLARTVLPDRSSAAN